MANVLYDALFGIHKNNESLFIVDPQADHSLSYAAFLQRSAKYANAIKAAGLEPGDRLIAQVGKSVSALALYASCIQSGVVYLPLNTAYTSTELAYFIKDSGAKLLIIDPASETEIKTSIDQLKVATLTLSNDGTSGSFIELAQQAPDTFNAIDRSSDDLAALLYTSGTTGRSKGAMLTHGNLLSNAQALKELWQFTDSDKLLHALPLFHTHGLFVACNVCLLSGAQIIFKPKFDINDVIENMPFATCMMGVPTFYTRLLDDSRLNKVLCKHIRVFTSGSAPLLTDTHLQFEQRTGHRILERYGMTETNMTTSNPYTGERRAGTVGHPLPSVEVMITDKETGKALEQGEVGQLEVRGPNVFKGYWNMPEKTAEEIRSNGFFITGDLARIDDDGYVSIVGRDKDLIISGGYNIYPKEIELVLDEQKNVIESAAVGVPHSDFGESVIAILVANESKVDMSAVEASVSRSLARFKHPKKYLFVDSLPRNTMGKVQKNTLREQYKDLFS